MELTATNETKKHVRNRPNENRKRLNKKLTDKNENHNQNGRFEQDSRRNKFDDAETTTQSYRLKRACP